MNCYDTEATAVALNNHINNAYEMCFPYKTINKNDKYLHKPSRELLEAFKLKKKLHKKFKKALNKLETIVNVFVIEYAFSTLAPRLKYHDCKQCAFAIFAEFER